MTDLQNDLITSVISAHKARSSYSVSESVTSISEMTFVADKVPCEVAYDWRRHLYIFTPKE